MAESPHPKESAPPSVRLQGHPWPEWIANYQRRVIVSLLAMKLPLHSAEEIAQGAWQTLMEKERDGLLETIKMPGLVLAQARFLALDYLRSESPRLLADTPLDEALVAEPRDTERALVSRSQMHATLRALEELPVQKQEIFRLFYAEDMTASQIAENHSISIQRTRQILCEVRAELRIALGNSDHE